MFVFLNDPFSTCARMDHIPNSGGVGGALKREFRLKDSTIQQVFMANQEINLRATHSTKRGAGNRLFSPSSDSEILLQ